MVLFIGYPQRPIEKPDFIHRIRFQVHNFRSVSTLFDLYFRKIQ